MTSATFPLLKQVSSELTRNQSTKVLDTPVISATFPLLRQVTSEHTRNQSTKVLDTLVTSATFPLLKHVTSEYTRKSMKVSGNRVNSANTLLLHLKLLEYTRSQSMKV